VSAASANGRPIDCSVASLADGESRTRRVRCFVRRWASPWKRSDAGQVIYWRAGPGRAGFSICVWLDQSYAVGLRIGSAADSAPREISIRRGERKSCGRTDGRVPNSCPIQIFRFGSEKLCIAWTAFRFLRKQFRANTSRAILQGSMIQWGLLSHPSFGEGGQTLKLFVARGWLSRQIWQLCIRK